MVTFAFDRDSNFRRFSRRNLKNKRDICRTFENHFFGLQSFPEVLNDFKKLQYLTITPIELYLSMIQQKIGFKIFILQFAAQKRTVQLVQ